MVEVEPTGAALGFLPALALPGISREAGLATCGGKAALYETILRKFLELKRPVGLELEQALDRGDLVAAERLAHSMITAAGTIGAVALSEQSRALQVALRHRDGPAIAAARAAFLADLGAVLQGLEALPPPPPAG